MATIALIQRLHPALNESDPGQLNSFAQQVHHRFFEVLEEESGHTIQTARTLEDYQRDFDTQPDIIICAPLPESGNLAPGLMKLRQIQETFPGIPLIVWSNRTEEAIRKTVVEEYGAVSYYTGTPLDAADDFADLILEHLEK